MWKEAGRDRKETVCSFSCCCCLEFHSATYSGGDAHAARREFLSYCLSLMRAHNGEHLDSLPILDVSALKHVAYVFDALIYYMRSSGSNEASENDILREGLPLPPWNDQDENENDEGDEDIPVAMDTESLDDQEVSNLAMSGSLNNTLHGGTGKGRKHSFFQVGRTVSTKRPFLTLPRFQRSESTLCLGCPPPDPFETPMSEALPLADQPHLLQPNARREDLFGIPKQPVTLASTGSASDNPLESLPTRLSLSTRTSDYAMNHPAKAHHPISESFNVMGPNPLSYPSDHGSESADGQKEAQVQMESNGRPESQPSTSSGGKRNYQSFESLLAAVKNETGYEMEERPQDLSCNKDAESDEEDGTKVKSKSVISQSLLNAVSMEQGLPTSRPQIIVSPRKAAAERAQNEEQTGGLSLPSLAGQDYDVQMASSSTSSLSRSPSKSVIVRAGSSAVSYLFV